MRVYDLARQLGVPAATVLEMARDLKLEVRNSLSSLTEEQCEAIGEGWQQLISVFPDPEEYRQSLLVADAKRQVQASVPNEWLLAPTSVAWVEERHLQELRVLVPGPAAQGFDLLRWAALKEMMIDGDELWTFCSYPHESRSRGGSAGVALVRDGTVVGSLATMYFLSSGQ